MPEFVHLHCHTQYSLLDGASDIGVMMDKAVKDGQKGVALTDHGNMFGAFKFVAEAERRKIKPIIGFEFYMVPNRHIKNFAKAKGEKDVRYHQLLLAKNQKGYENLTKLCSLGFIEGLYSKFPRIDKELLLQYHEGLIASSCCIGAEVPQTILKGDVKKAEELLKWWIDLFGEDYYIELQRHRGLEDIDGLGISQEDVNQTLLGFAKKYNLKVIATNDSHYVEEEDYMPHDILLCVNTGSLLEDKSRFKFPSSDFYFKTQQQMSQLFSDVPDAIANTMEIYDKIDTLKLARNVLLPNFPIPQGIKTQDDYLRILTYEGAKKRYKDLTPEIIERIDFELEVIKKSGYPGYFLIVQDFTTVARQMNVSVGPGRGSAAGSAVAYCIGITNVDPIKYDLLFERFLNPERISMPDIDIDFDDEGRQKVIDYVINKYGQNQVAQIITYGTMAAKSSIKDVGRVMDVPLSEVTQVTKTFPSQLGATLKDVLAENDINPRLKEKMNAEDIEKAYHFRELAQGKNKIAEMINTAKKLEGSIRNTGIHACGVIITPDDITNYVPVKTDKDSDMLVSQFDNSVAEEAGLLKMDFLGLKTLTIIKDAVRMVKETHGINIDPDEIPLDDKKTYQLFQRGETVAIFQYESTGMQKYMKELIPTTFEDLIAMNALYRPGPLEYIPTFVNRKHGREPIVYDLQAMEEYLKETYGVCVAGDTLIYNPKTGQRHRIDELEQQVGDFYVQGIDENLQTQFSKITYWVCNGEKDLLEVCLRNGSKVKITADHQVLTEMGWQEIGELEVGDTIATPRVLEVFKENRKFVDDTLTPNPYKGNDSITQSGENSSNLEENNDFQKTEKSKIWCSPDRGQGSMVRETAVLEAPEPDIFWEEITSITPVAKEKVYDITVEGIHNFVGNNIILHNCVYQEQVMLLSQKLANFSKGEADMLRKAMGKKKKDLIDKMYPQFIEGGEKNGHPKDTLDKVWKDWEAFASYAFNKSHSTCYAFVAFQTAYLKAHYPAEFMASVLTHNKSDISKLTFFLRECKRMGLDVLGPSVNESASDFSVNKKGQIRFGMSALKGVGEGPVEILLEDRQKNGEYKTIFDLMRRLSATGLNKRVMESLAYSGAFDEFENLHRAQYFVPSDKFSSFLEHLLKYGSAYQNQKAQAAFSLFGGSEDAMIQEPLIPECEEWNLVDKLNKEKEVTGIFISGHPLDDYRMEIENFVSCGLDKAEDHTNAALLKLAGLVVSAQHRMTKNGNGWGIFEMQDYNGGMEFRLFGDDYQKFKHLFETGKVLYVKGKFQKSWQGDRMDFKVQEVSLLEGMGSTMTECITLKVPIERIDKMLMQDIESLCERHKGKHQLKMIFLDHSNKTSLTFKSLSNKVNVTNDFINAVDKIGLEYKLN